VEQHTADLQQNCLSDLVGCLTRSYGLLRPQLKPCGIKKGRCHTCLLYHLSFEVFWQNWFLRPLLFRLDHGHEIATGIGELGDLADRGDGHWGQYGFAAVGFNLG